MKIDNVYQKMMEIIKNKIPYIILYKECKMEFITLKIYINYEEDNLTITKYTSNKNTNSVKEKNILFMDNIHKMNYEIMIDVVYKYIKQKYKFNLTNEE